MSTGLPKSGHTPDRPRIVPILKVVNEASSMKSLTFRDKLTAAALPGQFGMVWAPGVDEVPMSLLPRDDNIVTITVKERGSGTRALLRKRQGDLIGVRGPYGRGFTCAGVKKVLMIGGGTGAIPLLALLRKLASTDVECSFIVGAHTSHELLFRSEIERLSDGTGGMFNVTTDDGSIGSKGLATDEAARVLRAGSFDRIYTCGPEEMMKKVVDLATEAQIPAEAGLERIFKCGSGICGSCCIGPYLACKDGPVFSSDTLRGMPEFGKSTRDASGRRITIG
ncbi:MAG TPA: dihydroorotate dehydrogenase electron transfer subunit [Candidatus Acidoferrum sp.]|nr:dihydroorotate dehydrogenase electron transfer subunit [Candidatus Acidoferrum sp.]